MCISELWHRPSLHEYHHHLPQWGSLHPPPHHQKVTRSDAAGLIRREHLLFFSDRHLSLFFFYPQRPDAKSSVSDSRDHLDWRLQLGPWVCELCSCWWKLRLRFWGWVFFFYGSHSSGFAQRFSFFQLIFGLFRFTFTAPLSVVWSCGGKIRRE